MMKKIYILIRQDESHTEIDADREINDPEEIYVFNFEQGMVTVYDCAEMFFDHVRSLVGQYAHEYTLGSLLNWNYGE
jgi:hypothetical protein